MNWFIHGRMGHFYMAEAGEGGDPSTATTTTTAEPAAASVLAAAAGTTDYIPEKLRTLKEDGSLDLEASSRNVAEAYTQLEKRLGTGEVPPKTADEYTVKVEGVEGFDWAEFKADPDTQAFLKGAHAKGLNNAQVEYVIDAYLKAAPGLIGGAAQLTQQDCTAALKAAWGDDQAIRANVTASYRAAEAFASQGDAPGNFNALMTKYGNDPDFIAFTANIGKELKEDRAINGGAQVSEADFPIKAAELRQQLQDLPAHDPKRKGIQAQLDDMYNRKYSPSTSRF
ncbi:hypothetical protein HX794_07725 [Pseudomonas costantinii]|uniref:hypothetical protein n=1 Tax=Pseudomonas costantinii TaxID=168469 RepID=UPI0015A49454|nr:hypothetical protein [Pseudomonas costantinii]NVZ19524.1 hypothetical protein [Pseudomonas costantinii]